MLRSSYICVLTALLVSVTAPARGERLSIAAAANLVYALEALNAEYQKSHPDTELSVSTGASGNLVAQIRHGAPFDVFLSADTDYPRALLESGSADAKSLTIFAVGRLVLWTTRDGLSVEDPAALVRNPSVRKLAIANLDTAPYGRAAKAALEKLDVWKEAEPKCVIGENITQTAQFVETGNADAGFVALSLVLSPKLAQRGHWVEIPSNLYPPLEQAAVLTTRGADKPEARAYLSFLSSPEARAVFARFGYKAPASTP